MSIMVWGTKRSQRVWGKKGQREVITHYVVNIEHKPLHQLIGHSVEVIDVGVHKYKEYEEGYVETKTYMLVRHAPDQYWFIWVK